MHKKSIWWLIMFVAIFPLATAQAQDKPVLFSDNLKIDVYPMDRQTNILIPLTIEDSLYDRLFASPPQVQFRTYLFDTKQNHISKIVDRTIGSFPAVAVEKLSGVSVQRWFTPDTHTVTDTNENAIPVPVGYKRVSLFVPIKDLPQTHGKTNRLYGTIRFSSGEQTISKDYFSVYITWKENPLRLTRAIESYIQEGSLTCEFASAKNALDMLGIHVTESELIKRFPQAAVYDTSKSPDEYYLGDYGFGAKLPQTTSPNISPLGGYGLHINTPYLNDIILPYASYSKLMTFSLESLYDAVSHYHPVIVQGLFISWDKTLIGGWPIKVSVDDRRGLIAGEHTYVVFGKTVDGSYRIKDPYKNRFITISEDLLLKSVHAFESYGAKANMVIVANNAF